MNRVREDLVAGFLFFEAYALGGGLVGGQLRFFSLENKLSFLFEAYDFEGGLLRFCSLKKQVLLSKKSLLVCVLVCDVRKKKIWKVIFFYFLKNMTLLLGWFGYKRTKENLGLAW